MAGASSAVDVFSPSTSAETPFGFGQTGNANDPAGYTRGYLPIALASNVVVSTENAPRFSGAALYINAACQFYKPPNATSLIITGYLSSDNPTSTGDVVLGPYLRYQNSTVKMTAATCTQIISTPSGFSGVLPNNNEWVPVQFEFNLTSIPEGRIIALDIRRNGAAAADTSADFCTLSGLFIGFK